MECTQTSPSFFGYPMEEATTVKMAVEEKITRLYVLVITDNEILTLNGKLS